MLGAILHPIRIASLLVLGLGLYGCGLADYEKEAQYTLEAVKESDEIDKAMAGPLKLPEKKNADGTDHLPKLFMRTPKAGFFGYKDAPPAVERDGDGLTLYRFSRHANVTKGEFPQSIYLGFSQVNHEDEFKKSLMGILEGKDAKKTEPGFKPRDGMKMDRYDFSKGGETTSLFLIYRNATDANEKAGVAAGFVFQVEGKSKAMQLKWMERMMKTLRLDGNADIAFNNWESRLQPTAETTGGK
ncbi:MAG: hypothetical protein EXR99_14570 [Gemmataceae bacterium]|nr:hypothetical protein [Gemmataceae bacterium]